MNEDFRIRHEIVHTPSLVEEAKAAILSNEEYRDRSLAMDSKVKNSYVYELTDGERALTYFGSKHTKNSESPVFDEIKLAFEKANPDMVYVEGFGEYINDRKDEVRSQAQEITPEEAKAEGEAFYTLKLAIDAGADFESPELRRSDEIHALEESGFSHKDIFNFYFARSVYGYQRQAKELSTEECLEYIGRNLYVLRTASQWPEEEFDSFEQKAIAELNVHDDGYETLVDPIPWNGSDLGVSNDISRRLSLLRDQYGLERIAEGLKAYKRIFVVYGLTHAVKLEPALRILLQNETSI